jgi:glycosyltransferase involved in cell wall biosynthesis
VSRGQRILDSENVDTHWGLLHHLLVEPTGELSGEVARAALVEGLPEPSQRDAWLILAVLAGSLPTSRQVIEWHRRVRSHGLPVALAELTGNRRRSSHAVRVISDGVVVDAHHTVSTALSTGIQRVVRNVVDRWQETREFTLLAWDGEYTTLREVPAGSHRDPHLAASAPHTFVIPWEGVYLLPELAVERPRLERIQALAEFSGNTSGVIGFDLVPITSAETAGPGMPAAFSENLSAVARMNRVATISAAAGTEYGGWRIMIESAGLVGPAIRPIELPMEPIPDADPTIDARAALRLNASPIVVCIGSHEPRKNHLAVLHAAELLWRAGHDFQLVFCGGNAWNSELFTERLNELRKLGRPVSTHSRVTDAVLNSLVRIARFSVFPSLNEGYGLPVAESLAAGTPVVTSRFGSMAEIGGGGGALLVDPRSDEELTEAMRRMLADDELVSRLEAEALAHPHGSWADYADELWEYLVG